MLSWEQRPSEIANLLNPAFCSLVLREAVKGYQSKKSFGMPYPLAFLVFPLVLHKPTRESFPKKTSAKMRLWLQNQPEIRIGFAERSRQLVTFTKEAILFGTNNNILGINDDLLVAQGRIKTTKLWVDDSEVSNCLKIAGFLGKWFTTIEDTSTIFIIWGIQP
jgi:hypothetical protein